MGPQKYGLQLQRSLKYILSCDLRVQQPEAEQAGLASWANPAGEPGGRRRVTEVLLRAGGEGKLKKWGGEEGERKKGQESCVFKELKNSPWLLQQQHGVRVPS